MRKFILFLLVLIVLILSTLDSFAQRASSDLDTYSSSVLLFAYVPVEHSGLDPALSDEDYETTEPSIPVAPAKDLKLDVVPALFSHSTTISYYLPAKSKISFAVFDLYGKQVSPLIVYGAKQLAGHYEMTFEAGDLPSGSYYFVLQGGAEKIIKKLIIAR